VASKVVEHIAAIANEGRLFAGAAERAGWDAHIPTCPDWNMRDLVQHLGLIHLWAAAHVDQPHPEPDETVELHDLAVYWPVLAGSPRPDHELIDWYLETNANLVRVLESAPPDVEAFTFLPAPSPLAMWALRQASETTVHRFDAEIATGSTTEVDLPFAVDGLNEMLSGFAPRKRHLPVANERLMQVHAVDTNDRWYLTIGPERISTSREGGTADLVLSGTAEDLYLVLWNRLEDSRITTSGDEDLLEVWHNHVRVRWS
jgi:uncharacterized protein (TIGR03083 family)